MKWFQHSEIRPFVFSRTQNLPSKPGHAHEFNFPHSPVLMDPFFLKHSRFATQILRLENRCFSSIGLTLPRWAFYDCSIMPGQVVGFACTKRSLTPGVRAAVEIDDGLDYIPLSLFICIPTNEEGHWVAHNLCSVNSILPPEERFENLGYLTKAFGLWYFNVRHLYGMTQWGSHSIKVHTNYGEFRVVSAFNEIHDYPETLTYLVQVDAAKWRDYLGHPKSVVGSHQKESLVATPYTIHPKNQTSMRKLHLALEEGAGPFYLSGADFLVNSPEDQIQIYSKSTLSALRKPVPLAKKKTAKSK